jgi:hypothetical protein
MGAQLELAQRISEVPRHGEGAALGQHMNARRRSHELHGGLQVGLGDGFFKMTELGHRLAHQLVQHAGRRAFAIELLAAHLVNAFTVAVRALQQVAAKHLLHFREAAEAQRIGKADHGRRLNLGRLGHRRHRAQGQVVGLLKGEARDALQLLGHVRVSRPISALSSS